MAISLKAARVNAGLTQKEAAERLGVTPTTISKWETKITYPTISNVKKLVEIYSISVDDIDFELVD